MTKFGVNICTLKPGASSSQRHWHEKEGELAYVLEGEAVPRRDQRARAHALFKKPRAAPSVRLEFKLCVAGATLSSAALEGNYPPLLAGENTLQVAIE